MVKLKHLKAYERSNTPDHLIEEIDALLKKLGDVIEPLLTNIAPNVILSAFNRLHCIILLNLVIDDKESIKSVVGAEVKALIGNIEDISNLEIFPKNMQ